MFFPFSFTITEICGECVLIQNPCPPKLIINNNNDNNKNKNKILIIIIIIIIIIIMTMTMTMTMIMIMIMITIKLLNRFQNSADAENPNVFHCFSCSSIAIPSRVFVSKLIFEGI